jgi:hypothetical protein
MDIEGQGLGIIWAQPYLLLLPWITTKNNWWMVSIATAEFVLVLSHGMWGAIQFDFRYFMDSLWILVPIIMLNYKGWRQWMTWLTLGLSTLVHIALVGRFI